MRTNSRKNEVSMEYNKNLSVLEQYRPELYNKITQLEVSQLEKKMDQIEAVTAKNGQPIIVINQKGKKVRLNSAYNPEEEAKMWAKQFTFKGLDNHITMYGFGTGYFAKELLKHMPEDSYLIIYEPSAEIFLHTLHHVELKSILKDQRICIGVEEINEFDFHRMIRGVYDMGSLQNLKITRHPGYQGLFPSEFEYFAYEVKESAETAQIDYNTLLFLAEGTLRNQFENIPKLKNSISVNQLKEIWKKEIPVIVVSAGPSLAEQIEQVREAKGKAIIVAVDRIVQYLIDHGIEPDIVATIDPHKNVKNFSTGKPVECPMFCLISSQPLIMERHTGRKIVCWCGQYLVNNYIEVEGDFPHVALSGSVATVAVAILGYLGTKKICLVGQDLAFHGEETHVDGVVSNPSGTAGRLVEGINGEKVKSRYDWINFIHWFEDFIVNHPDIQIIDTKKSGALIKGSIHMDLKEAIGESKGSVKSLLEQINTMAPAFTEEQFGKIKEQIEEDLNKIEQMKKKAKEGAGYCADLIHMVKQGKAQNRSLDIKVEKVRRINEYLCEKTFYPVLDDLVTTYMNKDYVKVFRGKEDENEELINVYDSSRSFFESLLKALKFVEPIMKDAVEQLK